MTCATPCCGGHTGGQAPAVAAGGGGTLAAPSYEGFSGFCGPAVAALCVEPGLGNSLCSSFGGVGEGVGGSPLWPLAPPVTAVGGRWRLPAIKAAAASGFSAVEAFGGGGFCGY